LVAAWDERGVPSVSDSVPFPEGPTIGIPSRNGSPAIHRDDVFETMGSRTRRGRQKMTQRNNGFVSLVMGAALSKKVRQTVKARRLLMTVTRHGQPGCKSICFSL
jgi:hypothetical protein